MDGLPFLPGNSFRDPTVSLNFRISFYFKTKKNIKIKETKSSYKSNIRRQKWLQNNQTTRIWSRR